MAHVATSSVTTVTAAQAVFNTAELLEQILMPLSMCQVISKNRVARNWKSIIEDSPSLQKKLFLHPHDNSVISPDEGLHRRISDAELNMFPWLQDMCVYSGPINLNPIGDWVNQGGVNFPLELFTINLSTIFSDPALSSLQIVKAEHNRYFAREVFRDGSDNILHSWRGMYLTNPPVTEICLKIPLYLGRYL